jgi:hypothetical protein
MWHVHGMFLDVGTSPAQVPRFTAIGRCPRFLVLETMGLSMLSVSSCGRVSDPSSCSEFCYARICLSLKENPVGFL